MSRKSRKTLQQLFATAEVFFASPEGLVFVGDVSKLTVSEIEALLLGTGLVREAAAVGVPDPVKGTAIVCVCVLRPGVVEAGTRDTLVEAVIGGLGQPFRPKAVVLVPDLPKTRNMKIMRRVVRAALLGQDPGDLSSLVNPEAVAALGKYAKV